MHYGLTVAYVHYTVLSTGTLILLKFTRMQISNKYLQVVPRYQLREDCQRPHLHPVPGWSLSIRTPIIGSSFALAMSSVANSDPIAFSANRTLLEIQSINLTNTGRNWVT